MPELWGKDSGVNRKLRELYARDSGGTTRKLRELYGKDSSGVTRKIFSSAIAWSYQVNATGSITEPNIGYVNTYWTLEIYLLSGKWSFDVMYYIDAVHLPATNAMTLTLSDVAGGSGWPTFYLKVNEAMVGSYGGKGTHSINLPSAMDVTSIEVYGSGTHTGKEYDPGMEIVLHSTDGDIFLNSAKSFAT